MASDKNLMHEINLPLHILKSALIREASSIHLFASGVSRNRWMNSNCPRSFHDGLPVMVPLLINIISREWTSLPH